MNEMLIFLLSPLGLHIHAVWQYLILACFCWVAFFSGWDGRGRSPLGTLGHSLLRLAAFFLLWAAAYGAIAALQWLLINWVLGIVTLGGLAVLVLGLVVGCGRRAEPVCWVVP